VGAGVAAAGYVGLVTGACPLDLGVARRVRPLGLQLVDMAAPREVVFDVIAEPYLGRAPRALAEKLRVLERDSDLVLAAHFTPLGGRLGYDGEIGADLWGLGQRWCALVARRWEQTVAASLAVVKVEAERRASSAVGARGSRPRPTAPPGAVSPLPRLVGPACRPC
jgi:hypothetical protein